MTLSAVVLRMTRPSSPVRHMDWIPGVDLPGIAPHIVQRGNDRQACFADDADYLHFRQELGDAARKNDCALHAYVLMTNHVHLLVTRRIRNDRC